MTLTGKLAVFHCQCGKTLIVAVVFVVWFLSRRMIMSHKAGSKSRHS